VLPVSHAAAATVSAIRPTWLPVGAEIGGLQGQALSLVVLLTFLIHRIEEMIPWRRVAARKDVYRIHHDVWGRHLLTNHVCVGGI
jgi:hypothetical protein